MSGKRGLIHLVATRVMGWEYIDRVAMGWGTGPTVWSTSDEKSSTFQGFSPLKEISHAWMIVEKLKSSHDFRLIIQNDIAYIAEFTRPSEGFKVVADSAQKAICLAALKAVGVQSKVRP